MHVYMPGRILDRHVGGNTTYARRIRDGLIEAGHQVSSIRPAEKAPATMVKETAFGLRRSAQPGELIHYVADTGPLIAPRFPSVVTVHGVASRWIDVARSARAQKLWEMRVRRAIRLSDRLITVSHSSASDISEVFDISPERIEVIHHGIDLHLFDRPASLSAEVRDAISGPYVLFLGNLEPRKNIAALVRAFLDSHIRELGVRLIIAGKPAWDYSEIMREIEANPLVTHLGFVSDDDRRALMQGCDLFVFPSLYEGFGFPVLEALASGAVVLSSNRGSLKEVAGPSLILEGLDTQGITEGLIRALTDTEARETCVRAGRDWASRFSWDCSVEAHIDVYQKALHR